MTRPIGEVGIMVEWSVAEPAKRTLDGPVSDLRVRLVNGVVNVMGTDEGPARWRSPRSKGRPWW